MSLCPEAATRAAMDDGEFWEHVLLGPEAVAQHEVDISECEPPDDVSALTALQPCPECGELGACAYDDLGRPLIHATVPEHEDDAP